MSFPAESKHPARDLAALLIALTVLVQAVVWFPALLAHVVEVSR